MAEPLLKLLLPDASTITRARRVLHWKALSIVAAFATGYAGVIFGHGVALKLAAGVLFVHAATAMATGIMHDANHGSFSRSKRVNSIVSYSADWLGASSHLWRQQHNVAHHHYTNIQGLDRDLEQDPFARLAPDQAWKPWHRFQYLYMWPLYGFLQVKWFLFGDINSMMRQTPEFRRAVLPKMIAGKVVHAAWALVLPMMFHTWLSVVLTYLVCSLVVGAALAVIFQVAHCVDKAEFMHEGVKLTGDAMVAHQLATTVDVASRSWVMRAYCWWLMGGLDHQVEHHLAPRVPHTAYRMMSKRVRTIAAANDIQYRVHASMAAAVASHARWLKMMGRKPVQS
jgi:linoleoyl-CoA desaturase